MEIESVKPSRIAYKGKYEQMKVLFILAATCFVFSMAFLFGAARSNIEMRQELMRLEGGAKLVVVK